MRTFYKNASAARFLLGGIGTGNISLNQNAALCDYELFNKPAKGFSSPYSFFAIRTESPSGEVKAKALESQPAPPFDHSHGAFATEVKGLPRFRHSEMTGEYPFVRYKLTDPNMPVEAGLLAFTPLIPLNADDSSLPAAVLRYSVKNISDEELTVSVAASHANLCNHAERNEWGEVFKGEAENKRVQNALYDGIFFLPVGKTEDNLDYFEMALLTTEKQGVTCLDYWHEGAWWDGLQDFWNDFTEDGDLTSGRMLHGQGNNLHKSSLKAASLCVKKTIKPGDMAFFEFIITWYRPNRIWSWDQNKPVADCCPPGADCTSGSDCRPSGIARNYYAKLGPALESAAYLIANLPRLEEESRSFVNALAASTLPDYVIDAVSANITVIRSTTCFRMADGTFFAWEGCGDTWGCCPGNCTHVWNYTQTMAFLFPELERSMRRTEFLYETDDTGKMNFRAHHYLRDDPMSHAAATDGQLGAVIRLYRDWKLCGDDDFLRELWPKAKKALSYAFTHWDTDSDGLLDGEQHNTYDIEFFGYTSMLNSIFFAALRAGEEIARYLNDEANAELYKIFREKGAEKLDSLTFNGEYYEQVMGEDVNTYKYQYGKGCLADQLLGQQLAHVSGFGYLLPEAHVKSAVRAIFRYNFKNDFHDHANVQRVYALNDNGGLLLCSWPNGGRPVIPFVYSDEVWTGIEYQVASHLIYEGFMDEGLKIVEACRNRHDGIERNPWNEVECGNHYARSLASYGVLLALTGFHCDAVNKVLTFRPVMPVGGSGFVGFFCCADGWGLYRQEREGEAGEIEVLYGNLDGYRVVLAA
ncbi:MAG: non-lysosomal glucosylceramidase [Defluviitaleaceae bacterium]|nr:non-lysosomal glucosylceramidase [Defluviitaleaceae bacterium]